MIPDWLFLPGLTLVATIVANLLTVVLKTKTSQRTHVGGTAAALFILLAYETASSRPDWVSGSHWTAYILIACLFVPFWLLKISNHQ